MTSRRSLAAVVVVFLAVNTFVDAVRVGDETTQFPSQINLKIFWMRHGFSCANVLKEGGSSYQKNVQRNLYSDPGLTNLAIDQAAGYVPEVHDMFHHRYGQIPMVFSSHMRRAQETAMANFPGSHIHPVPYVSEEGVTMDNKPRSMAEQAEAMRKYEGPVGEIDRIKYYNDVNPSNARGRGSSDYQKFLTTMPNILHGLFQRGVFVPRPDGSAEIIIVSHSHFMGHNLHCGANTPLNNEIWEVDYTLSQDGTTMAPAGANGNCHPTFRPTIFLGVPRNICEPDVARCRHKPEKWIQRSIARGACTPFGGPPPGGFPEMDGLEMEGFEMTEMTPLGGGHGGMEMMPLSPVGGDGGDGGDGGAMPADWPDSP